MGTPLSATEARDTATSVAANADPWNRLTRWLSRRVGYGTAYSLLIYLATRMAVALGVITAYLLHQRLTWHRVLTVYDASWYQRIAIYGYGRHLRLVLPHVAGARYSPWAFYPGYPLLIRALHDVTQIRYDTAAFLLALVLAGLAVRAVYALGEAYGGASVARGSVVLFAGWPGSAAMNLPYSEGLFIAAAAASLAALLRKRWLLAGVLGAVATLTRAIGLALVVAAVVVAVREWRVNHDRAAVVAPLLTAAGVGSFYAYGWWRTGDPFVWRHAEDLWHQRLDFGAAVFHHLTHDFAHRGPRTVATLLLVVGLLMVILMAVAGVALRSRAGLALTAYAVTSGFMILAYGAVGPRPRMVLALIPGFVWLARWMPARLVDLVAVAFASTLALTAFLYVFAVVP
jgi:hypothetical protein